MGENCCSFISQNLSILKFVRFNMKFTTIILLCLSVQLAAQDPYKNIYSEKAWTERDKWQKSEVLIKLLKIKGGSHVADIGCHEGYMTFKLAQTVKEQGKVYAVDVEPSKLDLLKIHLQRENLKHVTIIKGEYDNPKLPLNQLNAVIILDTYHEMDDHDQILQHVKASLKVNGRLLLCEPIAEERKKLQRSEQEKKHELGMMYALEDLKKAGFKIIYQKDPFIDRTNEKGDKMWVIVAEK
jgi:ubiquinone/menaquinone biosynthesis C-methylase UbiE